MRGTQLCIGGVPSASYENGERCETSLAELLFTPRARAELPQITVDYIAEFSAEGGAKLLLCHHPEYYRRYLRDCDTGIICAGHAHGGQIRLFRTRSLRPRSGLLSSLYLRRTRRQIRHIARTDKSLLSPAYI